MSAEGRHAVVRLRAALAVLLGAVLTLALPLLLAGTAEASAPAPALTVLALAAAVLLAVNVRGIRLLPHCAPAARPGVADVPPILVGRVTDPLHHPLRPRAPGLS